MTAVFMEDLACVLGLDVVIVISGNSWGLPQSFFWWLAFVFACWDLSEIDKEVIV